MSINGTVHDTSSPRLSVSGVGVKFGGTVALDGVDLDVMPGEVLALVGENGAGKSTLMKVLSGAVTPITGSMTLEGNAYAPRNPQDARRSGMAMIYQELSLAPALSVTDNIFLGMEPHSGGVLRRAEMRRRAAEALDQLGQQIPVDEPVNRLSISDRQLVEIARASAVGCNVLILDEPTSSITRQDVDRLFGLIKTLKQQGKSIIYISHFIEEVQEICDRFVVLRDGRTVGGGPTATTSPADIVNLMVGRSLTDLYPHKIRSGDAPSRDPALEVYDLAGSTNRLDNATLTLHHGEVVGIFGLVGSGRTELLRCIFGLDAIKSGKVKVGTYTGMRFTPADRWQQKIGLVSEDRKGEGLALNRSIAENLILSYPQAVERNCIMQPRTVHDCARRWIEKLSVKCRDSKQPIGELSGGNQQKVAIARLLHHDVDVLLLDEPTRGIDVGSKRQIYELIDALAAAGKAVLIVSSYLPELLGTCDRIAVMARGRLLPARPVAEITEESVMLQATGSVAMS